MAVFTHKINPYLRRSLLLGQQFGTMGYGEVDAKFAEIIAS
jgi:hypothetical protein